MTMRIGECQAERLSDDRLMTLLIQTAAEARRRPALKADLRRWHAEELQELKCEMLVGSNLEPEEIVSLTEVSPEPELPAHGIVRRLERVL